MKQEVAAKRQVILVEYVRRTGERIPKRFDVRCQSSFAEFDPADADARLKSDFYKKNDETHG